MKKVLLLLSVIVFVAVLLTSCYQTQPCPSYNTYKHYQIENAF